MSRLNELIEKLRTLGEGNLQNRQKGLPQALQVPFSRNAEKFTARSWAWGEVVGREDGPPLIPDAQPAVGGRSFVPEREKLLNSLGNGTCKTSRSYPEKVDPYVCTHCHEREKPNGALVVPFGTDLIGHTWLHSECWHAWHALKTVS